MQAKGNQVEAPNTLKLWVCCHCHEPRKVGLTVCDKCHQRLHDTAEYVRADLASSVREAKLDALVSDIAQDVSAFFLDENAAYNIDTLPNIIRLHLAKHCSTVASDRARNLPTVADLLGSDPDFTGNESTDDYIRRIRGRSATVSEELISRAAAIQAAQSEDNIRMVGGSTGDALGTARHIANAISRLPTVPAAADAEATRRRCIEHLRHKAMAWDVDADDSDGEQQLIDGSKAQAARQLADEIESLEVK